MDIAKRNFTDISDELDDERRRALRAAPVPVLVAAARVYTRALALRGGDVEAMASRLQQILDELQTREMKHEPVN